MGIFGLQAGERSTDRRQDSAARKIADILTAQPAITINAAAEALGVSFQAASKGVLELMSRGILVQSGDSRRNRRFVAHEVVEILDRPYESGPTRRPRVR